MGKKISVNEDDFKKMMLMLKHSREFMNIPPTDLMLINLWRVVPKLVEKVARQTGYVFIEEKGRKFIRELKAVKVAEISENPLPKEAPIPPKIAEEASEPVKVPRCRKRTRE